MKLFNKVAIVGVGLIGGSLGLCIKKKRLTKQVIGISRHRKTINLAKKKGAIDYGYLNISAVSEADLVILSSPVNSITRIGLKIKSLVKPDALIIDTGSTKRKIVKTLQNALPNFVGTHPLSGSEKQGVINAKADLFCGSLCIVTPTAKTSKSALSAIEGFWGKLGARVVYLSPERHDNFVSYISHLPHIVAFSLMQSVPRESFYLASSGLKDSTRIAESSDIIWRDIFLENSDNVLKAIKRFSDCLSAIKSAIEHKDSGRLDKILKQARLKRQDLGA